MPEPTGTNVYTVTQITERISLILSTEFSQVAVEGEISSWKVASSGHAYFSLKDESALLKAVMWRSRLERLDQEPADGQLVRAYGRLSVYPPRGDYQLDVHRITQAGVGLLQKRFEELKRKLQEEGLFDPERKKEPPRRITRVLVITSPTGAAIRDFLRVVRSEDVPVSILILPVRVQGVEAPGEIATALRKVREIDCDLVILTRGGGSLEDLWAFNEEAVARAIAECEIPVVSAVGHEIDTTIADLVADIRVPTPTAAAQWLVDRARTIAEPLQELTERLIRSVEDTLEAKRLELDNLLHRLRMQNPLSGIPIYRQNVDDLVGRGWRALRNRLVVLQGEVHRKRQVVFTRFRLYLGEQKARQMVLREKFLALEPQSVLRRGFARCETVRDKHSIRSLEEVPRDDDILIHLIDGAFRARPLLSEPETGGSRK